MNPYQVLHVSPDATDDEVKKAYRKLAKQYHPDVSNEVNAETKFKEVQAAYDEICDIRSGKTFSSSNNSYYNDGYRNTNNNYYYNNSSFYRTTGDSSFNTAYDYIQQGRFKEANDVLETIKTRTSMWFYLSAIAQNGMGNRDTAKTYAKAACDMEPTNFTYRSLYNQLYRNDASYNNTFGTTIFSNSPILRLIFRIVIIELIMMFLFGRGTSLLPFIFFL